MLLFLWRRLGALGCATWTGFPFAILVMWHFYQLADERAWDGTTAPDSVFVAHILTALIGGFLLGRAAFRWATNRMDSHDAAELQKRWIDRRLKREMEEVRRG